MDSDRDQWLEGAKLLSIGLAAAIVSAGLVIGVGRAILIDPQGGHGVETASRLVVVSTTAR